MPQRCDDQGVLLALLILTMLFPAFRIWPTPGAGSWQSYVFWPLFRGLNVLCFAVAIADQWASYLALPAALRLVAHCSPARWRCSSTRSACSAATTATARRQGLVTGGIYRWTRNPQNAMLVVVYACLAVAADSGPTYLLCAAMMAVYTLMVLLEEPWLEGVYGEPYRRYCRRVPRFFNWRRAAILARTAWRRRLSLA